MGTIKVSFHMWPMDFTHISPSIGILYKNSLQSILLQQFQKEKVISNIFPLQKLNVVWVFYGDILIQFCRTGRGTRVHGYSGVLCKIRG